MSQARQLFDALGVTSGRIRILSQVGSGVPNHGVIALEHLETEVEERAKAANVWVSTSSFGTGVDAKGRPLGTVANVVGVNAFSVDLDVKDDGMPSMDSCVQFVRKMAQALGVEPAVVVGSGHGVQVHWAIDDPQARWEEGEDAVRDAWSLLFWQFGELAQHLAAEVGGQVDSTVSIERIWRCPGTTNKKKDAEPVEASLLLVSNEVEYVTAEMVQDTISATLGELPTPPEPAALDDDLAAFDELPFETQGRLQAWLQSATNEVVATLQGLWADAGEGWDNTVVKMAFRLVELAESPWCPLTHDQAREILLEHAPTDAGFPRRTVERKLEQAYRRPSAGAGTMPPAWLLDAAVEESIRAEIGEGEIETTPVSAPASAPTPSLVRGDDRPMLQVKSDADMAEWLRLELGTGATSGIFMRGGELAFTPVIGERGYEAISAGPSDDDGPAQVRPLTGPALAARLTYTFRCYREKKDEDSGVKRKVGEIFPMKAANVAALAPDKVLNLRPLNGVTHSPTVRSDGSLLTTPGYDEATGLLYLPTGAHLATVPEMPTNQDVTTACQWLQYMLQDFQFVTDNDRMNYLGMLMTPLLRNIVPAPFKMALIEAHQPGSGKTFLARALMTIHGGVFRAEMPREDVELQKQITSVLDVTTGPVAIFDNATGTIRSSVLAGLLTTGRWNERRLGTGKQVSAVNDRLWVITGNNLVISGDLARRTLRCLIDPGVPNPHLRTKFAIADFESWVREHRADILWSLLVLIRHWFAAGQPIREQRAADSYSRWATAVDSILTNAGIPGSFDDPETALEAAGGEDDEWGEFLQAIYDIRGTTPWTVKEILSLVDDSGMNLGEIASALPIPYDALPSELTAKRKGGENITKLSKSLGHWLKHRDGRWANDLTVKPVTKDRTGVMLWKIQQYGAGS